MTGKCAFITGGASGIGRAVAEAFVGQLLRYGTGGEIHFSDKAVLKRITEDSRKNGYGLRSLLRATLTSPLFLEK